MDTENPWSIVERTTRKALWKSDSSEAPFLGKAIDVHIEDIDFYFGYGTAIVLMKVVSGIDPEKIYPYQFVTHKFGVDNQLFFNPSLMVELNDFSDPYILMYGRVFTGRIDALSGISHTVYVSPATPNVVVSVIRNSPLIFDETIVKTRDLICPNSPVRISTCSFDNWMSYDGFHITLNRSLKSAIVLNIEEYTNLIMARFFTAYEYRPQDRKLKYSFDIKLRSRVRELRKIGKSITGGN